MTSDLQMFKDMRIPQIRDPNLGELPESYQAKVSRRGACIAKVSGGISNSYQTFLCVQSLC